MPELLVSEKQRKCDCRVLEWGGGPSDAFRLSILPVYIEPQLAQVAGEAENVELVCPDCPNFPIRMSQCACKVGACAASGCNSRCKRCGCDCNGVVPGAASRTRGRVHAATGVALAVKGQQHRKSAVAAKAKITEDSNETPTEGPDFSEDEGGLSVESLWRLFGFTASKKRSLPSINARKDGVIHKDNSSTGQKAWATLVQTVLKVATMCAQVLYPGNHMILLETMAYRILGKEAQDEELVKAAERGRDRGN